MMTVGLEGFIDEFLLVQSLIGPVQSFNFFSAVRTALFGRSVVIRPLIEVTVLSASDYDRRESVDVYHFGVAILCSVNLFS